MPDSADGKVGWVTGGGSGVGAANCRLLGAAGAKVLCFALGGLAAAAGYGESEPVPQTGRLSFTLEQAEAGRDPYVRHCGACHGEVLEGSGPVPALADEFFDFNWGGKPADSYAAEIRRMPPPTSGQQIHLDESTYTNLFAFVLHMNGIEAGALPMPAAMDELAALTIPTTLAHKADLHTPNAASARKSALLNTMPALSKNHSQNPKAGDWLHWGRTYNGHGYSPLSQIDSGNVGDLKLAWKLPLHPAPSHATPLVYQGVMYLHAYPDTVLALDAADGSILWRYRHASELSASGKLGLAIAGRKLFMPTSDMKLLAIDTQSGELIWEHGIATGMEYSDAASMRDAYYLRSPPMVVGDRVIQGVAGPLIPRGCFIVALDIDTGKEVWRFNTVPRHGEPGGHSWNGVPVEKRSGGSVWQFGTYDADLNLVFYGVGQTYDTAPLLVPSDEPGITNEALYTNSTIAIDPGTGELAWHYQHMAAEQWDLDWAFERQVVELTHRDVPRKAVVTIGKIGILDALDAATGEYLFSVDLGIQNYVTEIDPLTGAKKIDPDKFPHPDMDTIACPQLAGARNWLPTAYNPILQTLYVAIFENCAELTIGEGSNLTSGLYQKIIPNPDAPPGRLGRLQSVSLGKRGLGWGFHQSAPASTGLLTTGGNLVFYGDVEPSIKALDARSGRQLWSAALDQAPNAGVTTYLAGGRQYVAISAGVTTNLTKLQVAMHNEVNGSQTQVGRDGAALWVFAL